mgnify:CR=1 FL=1
MALKAVITSGLRPAVLHHHGGIVWTKATPPDVLQPVFEPYRYAQQTPEKMTWETAVKLYPLILTGRIF